LVYIIATYLLRCFDTLIPLEKPPNYASSEDRSSSQQLSGLLKKESLGPVHPKYQLYGKKAEICDWSGGSRSGHLCGRSKRDERSQRV